MRPFCLLRQPWSAAIKTKNPRWPVVSCQSAPLQPLKFNTKKQKHKTGNVTIKYIYIGAIKCGLLPLLEPNWRGAPPRTIDRRGLGTGKERVSGSARMCQAYTGSTNDVTYPWSLKEAGHDPTRFLQVKACRYSNQNHGRGRAAMQTKLVWTLQERQQNKQERVITGRTCHQYIFFWCITLLIFCSYLLLLN